MVVNPLKVFLFAVGFLLAVLFAAWWMGLGGQGARDWSGGVAGTELSAPSDEPPAPGNRPPANGVGSGAQASAGSAAAPAEAEDDPSRSDRVVQPTARVAAATAVATEGNQQAPTAPQTSSAAGAQGSGITQQAALDPASNPGDQAAAGGANTNRAAPSFDILRVEGDGGAVIAGQARPGSQVDVMLGGGSIGRATAAPSGDFAIVLDQPLPPGDHQLTLRDTPASGASTASAQTAVVSVPKERTGQVLALVEEPGQASRILTLPEGGSAGGEQGAAPEAGVASSGTPATEGQQALADPAGPAAGAPGARADETPAPVAVRAVEIEGAKVFVAGTAPPGATVRVYAGAMRLGDAVANAAGQFLVEGRQDLPVGNYVVRADLIGPGGEVLARAGVPFQRDPGETVAAFAPAAPNGAEGAAAGGAAVASAGQESVSGGAGEASPQASAAAETPAAPTVSAAAQPDAAAPQASAIGAGGAEASPADASALPPDQLAPALQAANGAVIIRRGDNLWRISRRVYGRGTRYATIYLANQAQIRNPDLILPGQVFSVPQQSDEGEPADLQALGDQGVPAPVQQ